MAGTLVTSLQAGLSYLTARKPSSSPSAQNRRQLPRSIPAEQIPPSDVDEAVTELSLQGVEVINRDPKHGAYLSPEMQASIALLNDGRLLILASQARHPHAIGFHARVKRSMENDPHFVLYGKDLRVLYVTPEIIRKAYSASTAAAGRRVLDSAMQVDAKKIFDDAVSKKASDIHLVVDKIEGRVSVFYRIHGDRVHQTQMANSAEFGEQLLTAIYQTMCSVSDATYNPSSRQDARVSDRNRLPPNVDGIRIATTPSDVGSEMVLRLLYDTTGASTELDGLGYCTAHVDDIQLMKRKPDGINIICGPTGSGKSTTLQRILRSIIVECGGTKHTITVEDPPEYRIIGALQTAVTNAATAEERSREFQAAIRSAMRLDPDIIMIGEMRDPASANLGIEAAITGHQVWTTLHTSSAMAAFPRLANMGLDMDMITDPAIITGVTCQRLLKVLCPHCKEPLNDPRVQRRFKAGSLDRVMRTIRFDGNTVYVRGADSKICPHCFGTGTAGMTVAAETIITDANLMGFLRNRDRIAATQYWLSERKGISMLQHAIQKVESGLVDPFDAEDVVGLLDTDSLNGGGR